MGISVIEGKNTLISFKNLIARHIDAVAALELAGDAMIGQAGTEFATIEKVLPPLKTVHYYLMFSHRFAQQHATLVEEMWQKIGVIRESEDFKHRATEYFRTE